MNKTDFEREFKNVKKKFSKLPENNESLDEAQNISEYANELQRIAKKMHKYNIENISIKDVIIQFSRYLYDVIDDLSILFSKKKYKKYNKWLKNKHYNNWWIPIINHIRVIFYILTHNDRIINFGILLVIISICLFFISITK